MPDETVQWIVVGLQAWMAICLTYIFFKSRKP